MDFFTPIIRGFQFAFSGNIFALVFTLLSIVQVRRGVQQINVVRKRRDEFLAAPLSRWKQTAAREMAFYAAIPVSVLIHELGHAIVVWLYGGRVIAFGFFFFWGFVQPDRTFDPTQEWILSAAGTWGSLLVILVAWLMFGRSKSASLRYFAKQIVYSHTIFALIYYPIFTGVFGFGDWRTIYDFEATPMLAGGWAVIHAGMLGAFWWLRRTGWFEDVGFANEKMAQEYAELEKIDSLESRLERVRLLVRGDAPTRARRLVQETVGLYPDSAEAHYLSMATLVQNSETVSKQAADHANQALSLGLKNTAWRAETYRLLSLFEKQNGNLEASLANLGEATALAEKAFLPNQHRYWYEAALLLRQLNRNEEGKALLEKAIEKGGSSAEFYKKERALFS